MKALGLASAFVLLLLLVMMKAMMVQAADLFGETRADQNLPPRENNGILYYIRADRFKDEELARKNCAADGGMLVEIGSWSEFNFIEDYISSLQNHGSGVYIISIGGKYQPDVSKWVFPTAGTPVPFFRPSYDLRNYDPSWEEHCLVLGYDIQFDTCYMNIFPCIADGYFYNIMYMCEKIHAPYYPTQLPNADPNIQAVEFRDKIYYIHKKLFTNYEANLQDCKADGGMMAEINDWYEFVVVQKYMKSTFGSSHNNIVFIGGKKTTNGWVLPSTNQSLPFVGWGPNEPHNLVTHNCLNVRALKSWYMGSMYCEMHVSPEFRFLCEKPKGS